LSVPALEQIAVAAYAEFYEANKGLFKSDIAAYWHLARQHKERRVREYKIVSGNYKPNGGGTRW